LEVFAAVSDRRIVGFKKLIDLDLSESATDAEVRRNCSDRVRVEPDEVTGPCGEPCNERAGFLFISARARREVPHGYSIPIMSEHEVVVIVGSRRTQADVRWIGVDVAKDAGCKVASEGDRDMFPHVEFSGERWITSRGGELDGSVVYLAGLNRGMIDLVSEGPSDDRVTGLV
jgi:hypothetical protein